MSLILEKPFPSLKLKIKTMEEVKILRKRQSISNQVSPLSHKVLVESEKCSQCDILKMKIKI